jgi:hypothetical protein
MHLLNCVSGSEKHILIKKGVHIYIYIYCPNYYIQQHNNIARKCYITFIIKEKSSVNVSNEMSDLRHSGGQHVVRKYGLATGYFPYNDTGLG